MQDQAVAEQLVAQAGQGSRQALEKLVRQIQGPVYGLALRMLFHPADAEDAAQEILIKVITNLKGFRGEGPFMAWALRIAANHLKGVRKSRAERREMDLDQAQAVIDQTQAKGWFSQPLEAPQPLLEMEMRSACIQALLLALDRPHRLAFILGTVMEVSSQEGAFIMEITPEAFRKRLSRARQRIKDFLALNCGLFDEANPCRCSGVLRAHLEHGWINPHKTIFAQAQDPPDDVMTLLAYMKEVDELGRVSALFKAYPRDALPTDFAAMVKQLLDAKQYRVLNDPQLM